LEPEKGTADLLCAFAQVCASRSSAVLILVGDGSMRPAVEAAAKANASVKRLGRLDESDVVEALSAADVAVLPSTFEPWGLVINEAMACGLPVIASDRVGCRDDLVRHEETGLLFPGGSVRALRDAMEYFIAQPAERDRMAAQASRLIDDWTLENWARNITRAWKLGTKDEPAPA